MNSDKFRYVSTQRDQDNVVVYLTPSQPAPESVPHELQEYIMKEQYTTRLEEIKRLAFQYYKPLFERVWMTVSFFAVIIVPMVIYGIIFKQFKKDNELDDSDQELRDFYKARAISFGIFLGLVALFYLPLMIWKAVGRRRMTVLLNRWALQDDRARDTMTFRPRWTVQMPSIFKSTTIVRISTPPGASPSVFQHGAFVPSFVNAPRDIDAAGAYYYPYGPRQAGVPRMSVVGNYQNAPPAYAGLGDYKGGFGDVKF